YSLPNGDEFTKGLKKVDCSISFSRKNDETAKNCKYVATTPHFLESWGDVRFSKTEYSTVQPTIGTLFNTRQFQESLLKWTGNDTKFYDYLRQNWEDNILKGASWNATIRDGIFESKSPSHPKEDETSDNSTVKTISANPDRAARALTASAKATKDFELTLYTTVQL